MLVLGSFPVNAQNAGEVSIPKSQVDAWMDELSNWGRWGAEDQLGTLNLITPAKRRAAAALVTSGVAISVARDVDVDTVGPGATAIGYSVRRGETGATDTYTIDYHGFALTHLDALTHIFADGRMYNGFLAEAVTAVGTDELGVETMARGIVTRAVLVDVPRLRDARYLEPDAVISVEDLEEWERLTGLSIGDGDALLISTGRWRRAAELGQAPAGNIPGLHPSASRWLKERNVAVLGCDCVSDRLPSMVEGVPFPLHQLAIVAMGMPLLDNLDLTAAVAEAEARARWVCQNAIGVGWRLGLVKYGEFGPWEES